MPNAVIWHRKVCPVTPNLVLSGDLAADRDEALEQLRGWIQAGVTHIVDVRSEENHDWFVAVHAPHITYHWLGVDDDGAPRDADWFEAGVAAMLEAWRDPSASVLVHCQMGINRGPSMGFAGMLAVGWDPIEALTAIRRARPIAKVHYAVDAVEWRLTRSGAAPAQVITEMDRVATWMDANPTYATWINPDPFTHEEH